MTKMFTSTLLVCILVLNHTFGQQTNQPKPFPNFEIQHHVNPRGRIAEPEPQNLGDAPDWTSFDVFGGTAGNDVSSIARDKDGNVYAFGSYFGEITFGDQTITTSGYGTYLVKLSSTGSIVWLKDALYANGDKDYYAKHEMLLDAAGNVYLVGELNTGTISFGSLSATKQGNRDMFLAKVSQDGNFESLKALGYEYLASVFNDACLVGDHLYIAANDLLIKTNLAGEKIWSQELAYSVESVVATDTSVFVSGSFTGEQMQIGDTTVNGKIYEPVAFIQGLEVDGHHKWVVSAEHSVEEGTSFTEDLWIDESGDLFLAFNFYDNITWGNLVSSSSWAYRYGVVRFDANGGENLIFTSPFDRSSILYASTEGDESIIAYEGYGETYLQRLDAQGASISNTGMGHAYDLFVSSGSNYLVASAFMNSQIRKLDKELNESWMIETSSSAGTMQIRGVEVDADGHVYVLGFNSGVGAFYDEDFNGRGGFIAKLDENQDIVWSHFIPDASSSSVGASQLYLHESGEVAFVVGYDKGFSYGEITERSADGSLVGVCGINGQIKRLKAYDNFDIAAVTLDTSGDMVVSGTLNRETVINGVTYTPFNSDALIIKLSDTGEQKWLKFFEGNGTEYLAFHSHPAGSNDIYFAGEFQSRNIVIGSDSTLNLSEEDGDVLLAKFLPTGALDWVKVYGGGPARQSTWPMSIAVDLDGNSHLSIWHGKEAKFGDVVLDVESENASYSKAVGKFDDSGELVWIKGIQEQGLFGFNYGEIALDTAGGVYVAASYRDSIDFGGGVKLYSDRSYDLYFAKYTASGDLDWVKSVVGQASMTNGIGVISPDNLYVSGIFNGSIATTDATAHSTSSNTFLARIGVDPEPVVEEPDPVLTASTVDASIYPNPAASFMRITLPEAHGISAHVSIIDLQGKSTGSYQLTDVREEVIDVSNLPKGLYIVKIETPQGSFTQKLLK
ncbi:T9SS type A sorting domain-containing protein [Marinoscillum furvescens]|uniref:Putative secreted protein (Por secretion system target) n=1 Tax=Marinoscillum furvescens DSM 4134 TaxID=1122208 RepID=A0A3D9L3V6_MARFU|nr:T9SS type A sorting domain-containing protein [Marinoscillum furvescens]RED97038.1 putative secreted protein (Por secretion system target) [Marinoscillum furvescens DSM 4134]